MISIVSLSIQPIHSEKFIRLASLTRFNISSSQFTGLGEMATDEFTLQVEGEQTELDLFQTHILSAYKLSLIFLHKQQYWNLFCHFNSYQRVLELLSALSELMEGN